MRVYDTPITLNWPPVGVSHLAYLHKAFQFRFNSTEQVTRISIVESDPTQFHCEVSVAEGLGEHYLTNVEPILKFRRRTIADTRKFNVVLLVPTGIGAEIGGHAGDATSVARLLSSVCDTLITHPNVVNASDINELPEVALYVEGSILARLLMGTAGLLRVRSNRVLTIIDGHVDPIFIHAAINAVNAARSTYGFRCDEVIQLNPPISMVSAYSPTGRATGEINNFETLLQTINDRSAHYDAIALSSVIKVPGDYHLRYFQEEGRMVNPWGGVEASLTHTLSSIFNKPTAHSPMLESEVVANMDPGVVDARMAAEAISTTYLPCILKGLHRSPRIVTERELMLSDAVLSVENVSCLVIPDGTIGVPTLAALEQGIPVVAVRENKNLMRNDLTMLPWAPDQLFIVENYWEAIGVVAALREGMNPCAVRRPLIRAHLHGSESATANVRLSRQNPSKGCLP